jgi:hypothetical protein
VQFEDIAASRLAGASQFTSGDIANGGSARLIDSLVMHGTPRGVLDRLRSTMRPSRTTWGSRSSLPGRRQCPASGVLAGQLRGAATR